MAGGINKFKLLKVDGRWVLSMKWHSHRAVMVFDTISAACEFIARIASDQHQQPQEQQHPPQHP